AGVVGEVVLVPVGGHADLVAHLRGGVGLVVLDAEVAVDHVGAEALGVGELLVDVGLPGLAEGADGAAVEVAEVFPGHFAHGRHQSGREEALALGRSG
ncbi:hypothetical protein ADL26_11260, partial [Thermoactinomyces vulgaris]